MFHMFAAADKPHIELKAEEIFALGPVSITNSVIFGIIGFAITLAILFYVAKQLRTNGKKSFLTKLVQWAFEGFYGQAQEIIGDKVLARKIFPLAITMWAFLDAAKRPGWVWAFSGRRQVLWLAAVAFGVLTVIGGLAISGYYLTRVKPQLAAIEAGNFS